MEAPDSILVLVLFCFLPATFGALLFVFFAMYKKHKQPTKWLPLIAGNLLVLLFLLSLLLVGGEIYYRFVYDTTDSFGLTKTTSRWFRRHFHYNASGFRDSIDYSPTSTPGRRRIAILGDSFTAGHGIADVEDRFANQLRAMRPEADVHAIAANGWDTGHYLRILKQMARDGYQFDIVVLAYCLNDIADIVPEWQTILSRIYDEQPPGYLVQQSYLLNSWYYRWKASHDPDVSNYYQFVQQNYDGQIWALQQQRLRSLVDAVKSANSELVVVTFPFLHALGPDYPYGEIHAALDQFWSELGVPHLDLLKSYQGFSAAELTVNRYDAHPNEKAHTIAARAIDRFLEDVLPTDSRPPGGPSSAAVAARPVPSASPPPPPLRGSSYLNTAEEVAYVGSHVCSECHPDETQSHRKTPHSKALGEIDLAAEPPDGEFEHQLSRRTYRVYRKDGALRHRESIRASDGEQLLLADYPMRYVIGSGNHSRSYLVEIDGFLCESPITWFASRQAWGMSPGFEDNPLPPSFSREARVECVSCHSGRVEPIDGALHRLKLHELVIGCENCHGPGQLHVQRHDSPQSPESGPDLTIVHPGRLDRERAEAICARCHLGTVAQAPVRGRDVSQFRPGLHLTDFLATFLWDAPPSSMTVVGHVEQMRLSRCYQASPDMTCTTCHNPHATPSAEQRVSFFREKCLLCHQPADCGLEQPQRLQQNAQDDCVACHMPRSPTDIAHFAFTHHRVGLHADRPSQPQATQPDKLVPLHDLSHLSSSDRDRCLGLAYLAVGVEEKDARLATAYRDRARELLERVYQQGLRDPDVELSLARIYRASDPSRVIQLAQSVSTSPDLSPITQVEALAMLSRTYFDLQQYAQAIPVLQRLTQLRRDAEDHLLLGLCHFRPGGFEVALREAQQAATIEPDRPDLQEFLAQSYQRLGDLERARQYKERARRLRLALPAADNQESHSP